MDDTYRTLFLGTLRQDSFLSTGGTVDPFATVDSSFCRDGKGRLTLFGSGIAGSLIATLRRLHPVPREISGSINGRSPSVWRFFNAHPTAEPQLAFRQHVAIHPETGAAAEGALFNLETTPPGTGWEFLLEVDTEDGEMFADLAREALSHWCAGRCLIGSEVSRGLGWLTLTDLKEYRVSRSKVDLWPDAGHAHRYSDYIRETFSDGKDVTAATSVLPRWTEYDYELYVGERENGYGIDSLSIGGHASEEISAAYDARYLDGIGSAAVDLVFDPDKTLATVRVGESWVPFIPGSALKGPLNHALKRLAASRQQEQQTADAVMGTVKRSAKLLIRDGSLKDATSMRLAWLHQHAEDEFTASTYESSLFSRVTVMAGVFSVRMVLEDATEEERAAFEELLQLGHAAQIGVGGRQWGGHGWPAWRSRQGSVAEVTHG